jgi:hypothetical protein
MARASHLLAGLVGITLTVGFYEGRRLIWNTARAISAASAELRETSRKAAREERRTDRDELVAEAEGPAEQVRKAKAESSKKGKKGKGDKKKSKAKAEPEGRGEALKASAKQKMRQAFIDSLTVEERQALRSEAQDERARRRAGRERARELLQDRLAEGGDGPRRRPERDPDPPQPGEQPMEDELYLPDTGFLPEE